MAGYSGTPLWQKLGYKTGMEAYVDGGPDQYLALLFLPADVEVRWLTRPKSDLKFVHLFATDAAGLKNKLKADRTKIAPDGVVWVSWPKKGLAGDNRHYGRPDSRNRLADGFCGHQGLCRG
jgi:hypothetical protein